MVDAWFTIYGKRMHIFQNFFIQEKQKKKKKPPELSGGSVISWDDI